MSNKDYIVVSSDEKEATVSLVAFVISTVESLLKSQPFVTIGLSGGSFIKAFSAEMLANREKLAPFHDKIKFLFCDERFVPFDNADSTYLGFESAGFFTGLGIPTENVYAIKPDAASVEECAVEYESRIRPLLNEKDGFDVLLLGVGPDGHTCSLFPAHPLFVNATSERRLVAPISDSPKPPPQRVTLTLNYINNSRCLLFWACGEGKADILKRVLADADKSLPSASVYNGGVLKWFIDKAAAKLL